jgi:uncharacterized OB-fold protein
MAKCKNCGTEVKHEVETCPSCGQLGGTAQTITDLPGADLKGERKKLFAEIREEKAPEGLISGASCESCGTKLTEEDAACPSCGMSGGAQTISDLPKVNLRAAHKKLKEEIREAREHDKEK